MQANLQTQFIAKLEEQYGSLDKMTSKFGNATFGKVADDLCISASQFTKLIYGNATDGMYTRTIKNVDRLIKGSRLEQALELSNNRAAEIRPSKQRFPFVIPMFTLGLGALLTWLALGSIGEKNNNQNAHPLNTFFDQQYDAAFHSPYLKESEVQDFCPCSGYEGTWSLNESYKLPLPVSGKPGIYYVARSADVRMKCAKSDSLEVGKGRVLMGYEHLINEIWVDLNQRPLSPTYFDKGTKRFTSDFDDLTFENNPQFKKVATINSFFIDRFEIRDDFITRNGEPYGRYATDVNQQLVDKFEIDLKDILENVLGDLTITVCEKAANNYCDPNDLKAGESIIDFECQYTISNENLGLGGAYPYTKGYKLQKQNYVANLTCGCDG